MRRKSLNDEVVIVYDPELASLCGIMTLIKKGNELVLGVASEPSGSGSHVLLLTFFI